MGFRVRVQGYRWAGAGCRLSGSGASPQGSRDPVRSRSPPQAGGRGERLGRARGGCECVFLSIYIYVCVCRYLTYMFTIFCVCVLLCLAFRLPQCSSRLGCRQPLPGHRTLPQLVLDGTLPAWHGGTRRRPSTAVTECPRRLQLTGGFQGPKKGNGGNPVQRFFAPFNLEPHRQLQSV